MKSRFIIIACGLCIGFAAIAEKQERGPLIRTVYRALQDKPETTIHVTPADAEAFWQRLVPPTLTEQPTELHEFKRTHAHMFWEPYADKRITVSGGPYCPCCFFAAIGYSGKGYSAGWTIRLDDYIAIGFPEGSTAHPAHFSSAHLPHVLMSSALGSTSCSDFTRQLCIGLNWRISLLT